MDAGKSHRLLPAILDSSPVGIVLFGRDQTVQHCNPAFERLVGRTAAEIVGHRLPLPESTETRWTSLVAQLNRGERFSSNSGTLGRQPENDGHGVSQGGTPHPAR